MTSDVIIAICFLLLGAGIATTYWVMVCRRNIAWTRERLDWWYEHSGKMLQHARNMAAIAEKAMAQGDWYREYLRGKIIIEDPSVPRRDDPGQA